MQSGRASPGAVDSREWCELMELEERRGRLPPGSSPSRTARSMGIVQDVPSQKAARQVVLVVPQQARHIRASVTAPLLLARADHCRRSR
jgi:hypothetical protein